MNILLILLLFIDGIKCLQNGILADSLSTYSNFVATIWQRAYITPRYLCSGTIITKSHILTAGHCVCNVQNYEIYVTVGRIDLNDMRSVMVHNIHLHHNFERKYDLIEPHMEYWLHDIAILELVHELIEGPHITWMPLGLRKWQSVASKRCYIMGWSYIRIDSMISSMTLQQADACILGDRCSPTNTTLLQNEIHVFITTVGTIIDDKDIGTALICATRAVGIIVGGRDRTNNVLTVLTVAPYKSFTDYITAGGVTEARDENFYNVVFISNSHNFRCGGFMVHHRHVVTAAHCVRDLVVGDLSVSLPHSTVFRTSNIAVSSPVENLEIHPFFNFTYNANSGEYNIENDIAVLKLKLDLPWNPLNYPNDLPDLSLISGETPCELMRWYHSSSENRASKRLMKSFGTILDDGTSEALGFHLQDEKFLVKGFYKQPIASPDDIGNPLIFENQIIGMVIAVTGYPDPVTCLKILPYYDFIRNVIV